MFIAVILCAMALPASAAPKPRFDAARRYDIYWGGVNVGFVAMEIRRTKPNTYQFDLKIRSSGVLHWISQYDSMSTATFRFDKAGDIIPLYFVSDGHLRGKHSSTELLYDKQGRLLSERLNPPKKTWKHADVPEALRRGAQNTLTGAVLSREYIRHFLNGKYQERQFSVPIYDGKRLGNYRFEILPEQQVSVNDQQVNTIAFRFNRVPVAGFSSTEIQALKNEPVIYIYFAKDRALLPIKGEAKVPHGGNVVVALEKSCASLQECITRP